MSFADLLVSLQLWKSAQNNFQKGLPTVSAILARAAEENLKYLLDTNDHDTFERIITNWLKICRREQYKTRRERRSLAEVDFYDLENSKFDELALTG